MGRHTLTGLICAGGRQDQDWSADYRLFARDQWEVTDLFAPVVGGALHMLPDGARWFLAGYGAIDDDIEFLQMSTGGAFELFEETETAAQGRSQSGYIMASDVSASANTVAFWTLRQFPDSGCLTNDDWVVGFIVLDRLED